MTLSQNESSDDDKEICVSLSNVQELSLRALVNADSCELYGLEIQAGIDNVFKKKYPMGSLYPALHKLQEIGFVESWWETDETGQRKGARRRYYKITGVGKSALSDIDAKRIALTNWKPVYQS